MALNSSVEANKSFVSCETADMKPSKSSVQSKAKSEDENLKLTTRSKIPKGIQPKKSRVRAKTADGICESHHKKQTAERAERAVSESFVESRSSEMNKGKPEMSVGSNETKVDPEEKSSHLIPDISKSLDRQSSILEKAKKIFVYKPSSDTFSKLESNSCDNEKLPKPKGDSQSKKSNETLKHRLQPGVRSTKGEPSKLPVKLKQPEVKHNVDPAGKNSKLFKTKREERVEDKIKNAMKENFSNLIPQYDTEVKKIMDTWVNTIYCSLTMRTNLIGLLFQLFPNIDPSQFHTENDLLIQSITQTKKNTKTEIEGLMQFIKSLLSNQVKTKEDYIALLANKEIAEDYNFNWKALAKKISDLAEETKQLQMEIPELEKRKEYFETKASEKIQKMEGNLEKKEEEIKKLSYQLGVLKQRENSYKGNVLMKVDEYKDIKSEVVSLKKVENELEELKAKYLYQNDMYEKKIKDLEAILEEKKKTLEKENEVRKQLQTIFVQLQAHQKHLCRTFGKDQVDFVLGRSTHPRNKRREQLWVSAVKLVLKGFLVQMKKLERDRNKMLLELNCNDLENFNALATSIIQKDSFIKTIKHQMNAFHRASKFTRPPDHSYTECIKN